jgi:hypothetical protein
MSFIIKCKKCGTERELGNEFLQLGHHQIDVYAQDEGDVEIECDRCENIITSSTV